MPKYRSNDAYSTRVTAAQMARDRSDVPHKTNGDEQAFSGAKFALSFTKGLDHNSIGLLSDPKHFVAFRQAIDDGYIDAFNNRVPVPDPGPDFDARRKWEAPTAGLAYDLQGPDCQAVTMAPAPAMGSDELAFEMAEVYELAILRDVPFANFDAAGGSSALTNSVARLNDLAYATDGFPVRPRKTAADGLLSRQEAFRGSSPGVVDGPYLSQFMLIGNNIPGIAEPKDGMIAFGAQTIDQRVPEATDTDFMVTWDDWHNVQQGFDVRGPGDPGQQFTGSKRFIHTPRDLATYVHFDALYQAYLNACLILLGMNAPLDPDFDSLSGGRDSFPSGAEMAGRASNVGGFALYGGPHILTLVTEVATRALKAARYQKFNAHIRCRPEVLAARIEKAGDIASAHPALGAKCKDLASQIDATVQVIIGETGNALLPMAFSEGSPMHPSYAAGHATVAGACVTVLKAFFDTGATFAKTGADGAPSFRHAAASDIPVAYESRSNGSTLEDTTPTQALTLEGELNKLAANISIGRNMAGVHYFSDYYDSLRMGEEIAIGMLEEQALCYPTDPFVMSLQNFDGDTVRIGAR